MTLFVKSVSVDVIKGLVMRMARIFRGALHPITSILVRDRRHRQRRSPPDDRAVGWSDAARAWGRQEPPVAGKGKKAFSPRTSSGSVPLLTPGFSPLEPSAAVCPC